LAVAAAQGAVAELQRNERQKDDERNFPDPTDEMMGRYASDSKELKGTPALPRLTGKSVMLYRFRSHP
jgi:hypothetical protein